MRPTRFGSKPSSARALTLFPEPDSPTRPRVSPGAIVYDRPRTAWTTLRAANSTRSLSTASNGASVIARYASVSVRHTTSVIAARGLSDTLDRVSYRMALIGLSWIAADPAGP